MDKTADADQQDKKRTQRSAMKTVFMTGITGLLGTNLAHELLQQDYSVIAIVRNPEKYTGKRDSRLHLVQMGLWDTYDEYLKKADIVVHIAAETATHLLSYADYENVNYTATVRLFEKAVYYGVSRFIFVSTANTIGFGSRKVPGRENHPIKPPFSRLFYAQSKKQAEDYLLSRRGAIPLKIINPTFMIGPYDSKPSSGKIILMGLGRKWVLYPPGGKNFVAVKDVVKGIISSFEKGSSGEKYLIAGENLSYRSFFQRLNRSTGQRTALIPVPGLLLQLLGIGGTVLRVFRVKTSISLTNMQALCVKNYYSNDRSRSELHVNYTSLDTAIQESVAYFRKNRFTNLKEE